MLLLPSAAGRVCKTTGGNDEEKIRLFFVKVYEERELEIRFGASYLEYRARTPMLFPGKPKR